MQSKKTTAFIANAIIIIEGIVKTAEPCKFDFFLFQGYFDVRDSLLL